MKLPDGKYRVLLWGDWITAELRSVGAKEKAWYYENEPIFPDEIGEKVE